MENGKIKLFYNECKGVIEIIYTTVVKLLKNMKTMLEKQNISEKRY